MGVAVVYQFRIVLNLTNVSRSGFAIETNERLAFLGGARLRLESEQTVISCTGEMVWCRLERTEQRRDDFVPVYSAGFRLIDQSEPFEQRALEAMRLVVPRGAAFSPGPLRR